MRDTVVRGMVRLLFLVWALAQVAAGEITGIVKDQAGAHTRNSSLTMPRTTVSRI